MAEVKRTHAIVPGTYDPVTLGHLDVIKRAQKIFDHVTVGVAASKGKRGVGTAFTLEERVKMIEEALETDGVSNVDVRPFEGLLVDLCHEVGAGVVVKGLRATSDFEFELQQADLNSQLSPDIESVFVMAAPSLGFVSSSVVRELAAFGVFQESLVPPCVLRYLKDRYQ
jgi:pantetheine-phosphate adenylyltransferase